MTNTKLFETATRGKYRFPYKGLVSVEDLWDISLEGLDSIYKTLNTELKKVNEDSLLEPKTTGSEKLSNMIEIVKYIVGVKIAERDARLDDLVRKEQKQKILEAIDAKKNENLRNASLEDLQKMLDDLD